MAKDETTYESQFTKENIVDLKSHISKSINEYALSQVDGGKLDLFLIVASLSQCVYEVVLSALPQNEADARKSVDEMKVLADKLIKEVDKTGQELALSPTSKLLASTHLTSIMSEHYARKRDSAVLKMIQDKAQELDSDNVVELPQEEE
jgi:hypothetical protein